MTQETTQGCNPKSHGAAPEAPVTSSKSAFMQFLDRWRNRTEYLSASLGLVCGAMAFLMLLSNALTEGPIKAQLLEDQLAVLRQVLPAQLYNNNPLADAVTLEDKELGPIEVFPARLDGKLTGFAMNISNVGYAGPVLQMVAIDTEGKILGVRVLAHKETPGLADRIDVTKDDWITRFDGLSLANTSQDKWKVKKDGGQFDQFAGATITPRAVVKSVFQALQFQERHINELANKEVQP